MPRNERPPKRVIHYRDAANEDYAGTNIDTKVVTADFPFAPKSRVFRFFAWIAYYVIAIPLVHLICFVFCGYHVRNKKGVRALKHTGYFLYANHTHFTDAFLSPITAFPKRAFVVVGPDTVSIKGLRVIVQMLGAIPIPQSVKAMRPYLDAVEQRIKEGNCVGVFPEGHMWNYCTFLRPFKAGSFRYPVALNVPSVAVAVTYQKRRIPFLRSPRRTVFVSDPFWPDASLPQKEAQRKLEREVEAFLKEKTETYSTYKYYDYRQITD